MKDAEAMEVLILAHENEAVVTSMGPDCSIGGRCQRHVFDVQGARKQIRERADETRR